MNAPTAPDPIAKAKRFFTPDTGSVCSFDVAIIELDRDVPNATIAPLKLAAPKMGDAVVAVGYGYDADGNAPKTRLERDTTVIGVGPMTVPYRTAEGTDLPTFDLAKGDLATGESHCNGDSGGPLFDDGGNVIGIISRGYPSEQLDADERAKHGPNLCTDLPEMYSGIAFNASWIQTTAKSLGVTLTMADEPAPVAQVKTETKQKATHDSDDDDDDTSEPVVANAGCNAAPGTSSNAFALLALALLLSRRRR